MRLSLICILIALANSASALAAETDVERVKEHFKSEFYTVTWGTPRTFDSSAELEIGDGIGHGFTLRWKRFRPGKDFVDVLSIELKGDWQPYKSKWPPDSAPVTVKHAQMKPDVYGAFLRDLAIVDAAKLRPVEKDFSTGSSADFWVYARLTANKKTLVDLDWTGYEGSTEEMNFAKPRAAVACARQSVKELEFKEHTLTEEERSWASEKFARDWKKWKESRDHYWWVRERYLITIGVVGDPSVLPVLQEILGGDPKDRCVYYAINAVTRLTKKDVREKPVEEMDVEKTRKRVLELLRDKK
jgi:hypothetical protein